MRCACCHAVPSRVRCTCCRAGGDTRGGCAAAPRRRGRGLGGRRPLLLPTPTVLLAPCPNSSPCSLHKQPRAPQTFLRTSTGPRGRRRPSGRWARPPTACSREPRLALFAVCVLAVGGWPGALPCATLRGAVGPEAGAERRKGPRCRSVGCETRSALLLKHSPQTPAPAPCPPQGRPAVAQVPGIPAGPGRGGGGARAGGAGARASGGRCRCRRMT